MALHYGFNITESDMKRLLEKNDKQQSGVRTWRQLFGNASLGYNAQSDALLTDYGDAIAQAYTSSFKQNDTILGAGLASGMTREMLTASRNDLHTAYETYVRNYGKDASALAENYGTELDTINTALTERAANFANLYNSAYKYLAEELYGATATFAGNAENGGVPIYEGKGRKAKLTGYEDVTLDYMQEHGLDWLTDNQGNLLPWETVSQELVNPDGSLTQKGVAFFDQMFNTPYEAYAHKDGERAIRSFDQWLSDTDSDLRDWWVGQDDFNYTFAGTNRGTAQSLAGRESTDDVYGVYEYVDMSGIAEFSKLDFGESGEPLKNAMRKLSAAETRATEVAAENLAQTNLEMQEALMNVGNPYYNPTPRAPLTADKEYEAASKAWQSYYGAVNDTYQKLNKFLAEKMSKSIADKFWAENSQLRSDFDSLMKRAKESKYYSKDIAAEINNLYNTLLQRMNAYIAQHQYSGKTSGF